MVFALADSQRAIGPILVYFWLSPLPTANSQRPRADLGCFPNTNYQLRITGSLFFSEISRS
jgi:hypothetical protein